MTKEDLLNQLNNLRQKWVGHVPKSPDHPDYWKFRCDNCIAIGLKKKLEKWGSEIKSAADSKPISSDKMYDVAKMIFG